MHGAATMAKNIRRTGIPATIKGRSNPHYPGAREIDLDKEREERNSIEDHRGTTPERLAKSGGHFTVGDNRQGTRIYHFHDTTIDRLYSRLARGSKGRTEEETVRAEYLALQRYKHHWHHSGLEATIGSVDLDRIFAPDPSGMVGMPKTERQAHHRRQYREARELLGWKPHIVVENIMCAEISLEQAGFSIGYNSPFRAREGSVKILRECGGKLAKLWGIT